MKRRDKKKKKSINDKARAQRVFPVPHSWVSLPWHYLQCSCHTHGVTQMAFIYFSFYISHEMCHPFSLLILKSKVLACLCPHSTSLPHCTPPLIYLNAVHFSVHSLIAWCTNLKMGSSVLLQLPEATSGFFFFVFYHFFKLQTDNKDRISDILSLLNQTQTTTLMYMKMHRNNREHVSDLPIAKSVS